MYVKYEVKHESTLGRGAFGLLFRGYCGLGRSAHAERDLDDAVSGLRHVVLVDVRTDHGAVGVRQLGVDEPQVVDIRLRADADAPAVEVEVHHRVLLDRDLTRLLQRLRDRPIRELVLERTIRVRSDDLHGAPIHYSQPALIGWLV